MLKHLQIENYALIESLNISLDDGFTVITGETGAGKSILLGALSLVLGQRADTRALNDPSKKCIIEASFQVSQDHFLPLFEQYKLDWEPETYIRREITPQGKSRAFINDTPVTLPVMKDITGRLIDIHSQHQNLIIGETPFQFEVVDGFSKNQDRLKTYRSLFTEWEGMLRRLKSLEEQERQSRADQDYFRFQFDELEKAGLMPDEVARWEGELEILGHAEEIKRALEKARFLLSEAQVNITDQLFDVLQQIRPLAGYREDFEGLSGRLESVQIEVKDIAREAEQLSGTVVYDPEKASELEQKMDLVNKLLLKHHVSEVSALLQIRDTYGEKLLATDSLAGQIAGLKDSIGNIEKQMLEAARALTEIRQKAIPAMEKEVQLLLRALGMPAARFRVVLQTTGTPGPNGLDKLEFLFSANPGNEPRELFKVASGGELSRLMLSIKSMISRKNLLSSMIFDEIDTGISGEIGGKIGQILHAMSERMQVIAITHLPQIAAMGGDHYQVYKTVEEGITKTRVKRLGKEERVLEIAKMLGGKTPTRNMVQTARDLMNNKATIKPI